MHGYADDLTKLDLLCARSKKDIKLGSSNGPQLLFQELRMGVDFNRLQHLVLKSVTDSVTRTTSRHSMALDRNKRSLGTTNRPNKRSDCLPMLSAVREDEDDPVDALLETDPPQWNSPGWLDKKLDLEGYCPEGVVYSDSTLGDLMASDDNINSAKLHHLTNCKFGLCVPSQCTGYCSW